MSQKGNTPLVWDSKASLCDENNPQAEDTTEVSTGVDGLTGAHFSLWGDGELKTSTEKGEQEHQKGREQGVLTTGPVPSPCDPERSSPRMNSAQRDNRQPN